jgi:DNA-directed RNA polymerase subunit H (RpoH/RPB5)
MDNESDADDDACHTGSSDDDSDNAPTTNVQQAISDESEEGDSDHQEDDDPTGTQEGELDDEITPTEMPQSHSVRFTNQINTMKDYLALLPTATQASNETKWRSHVLPALHTMIVTRGYQIVSSEALRQMPPYVVHGHMIDASVTIAMNSAGDILGCFAPTIVKIGIGHARKIIMTIRAWSIQSIIMVLHQPLTPVARTELASVRENMVFYNETELSKNAVWHQGSPKQRALTPAERSAFLLRYKLTPDQLPVMYKTDVVAKYYGWPTGTLVQCIRSFGGSTEPHVYMRVVC